MTWLAVQNLSALQDKLFLSISPIFQTIKYNFLHMGSTQYLSE